MIPPETRIPLVLILVAAMGLRLGCGAVLHHQRASSRTHATSRFRFPDSYQFDACARNLLGKGEYVDNANRRAWRTPAYSLLLAGLYRTVGSDPVHARIMTNLLDLLNVFLVYCLGSMLFSQRAGLLAAGMAAGYPFLIYFSNLVLADTLGVTAVLLVTMAFTACGHDNERAARYLLPGLALGFAIMVKASFCLLGIPFILLVACKSRRSCAEPAGTCRNNACKLGACARMTLFVLLGLVIGMGPWWIRNQLVFGEFVPLSTMGGFTLYESNSNRADGGPNNGKSEFPATWRATMRKLSATRAPRCAALLELEADRILREHALRWIRSHPRRFLQLVPTRIYRTWNVIPNWSGAQSWFFRVVSLLSYGPVMLLALYALYAYRGRWYEIFPLILPALYITCLHSVFMGSIRYRLPAMGCMLVLAGAGLNRIYFEKTGVSDP